MKIVVALGGNALGNNPVEQLSIVKKTARRIVDIAANNEIILTHGNGPQVGMIYNFMNNDIYMPFPESGAMSQGYIGYHLQQALENEIKRRKLHKRAMAVITEVEVDLKDDAFKNPTKPIGPFYTKAEAEKLMKETKDTYKEDAGRGYRRVIASPKPLRIVELSMIRSLVRRGNIVVTCGGGGIPVIKRRNGYEGVPAVIDKDRTSSLLAKVIDADILLILTTVETVKINFGTKDEKAIRHMTLSEAKKLIKEGHFKEGSMLPKVEACMEFVKHGKGKKAIITSLSKASEALKGNTGTVISKEEN